MFVAMNRFRIAPGREDDFETIWRERDSRLADVPGFKTFKLLRGPRVGQGSEDDHVLYISHSQWQSREAFEAWTRSPAFRAAHAKAGDTTGIYLSPPNFEGFEAVLEE
ncbi:MAG: antibiotic biosynthesis monooxygenase [Pseudomonadota bacterium]